MGKTVNKICVICGETFRGRRDAQTCSPTCRKRLQRQRSLKSRLIDEAKKLEQGAEQEVQQLAASLFPQQPALVPVEEEAENSLPVATETEEPSEAEPGFGQPVVGPRPISVEGEATSEAIPVHSEISGLATLSAPANLPLSAIETKADAQKEAKKSRRNFRRFATAVIVAILLLTGGLGINFFLGNNNHTKIDKLSRTQQEQAKLQLKQQITVNNRTNHLEVKVNELSTRIDSLKNSSGSASNLSVTNVNGITAHNLGDGPFNGPNELVQLTSTGQLPVLDGSNLTDVNAITLGGQGVNFYTNASNLTSGTLSDARLSANVALLDGANIFTAANTFNAHVILNTLGAAGNTSLCLNGLNQIAACSGSGGSGVTSLDGLVGGLNIANSSGNGTTTITIDDASTTQKGLAQFNNTNFSASGGIINTIQNIDAGASPTFGGLTVSGLGTGVVQSNSGVLSTGSVALGSQTSGNYIAGLGTLTGLNASVSSGAGITPNLSVLYGATGNTAVQGNTAITCASGTGNLSGGGNSITLGTGGTCGAISITDSPTFTGTLAVQGAGGITVGVVGTTPGQLVLATSGSGSVTLQSASQSNPLALSIPDDTHTTDTICLQTRANCSFSGSTAGGDLSGTYPNPQVVGLRSTPLTFSSLSAGQILQYNGSAFVNQTVSGDVTIDASGVTAIGANKVTDTNLLTGTFTHITGVGPLGAGSIGGSFGIISTGNNIQTTATVQGGIVNATTGFRVNGAATLGNYLRGDGTNFVSSAIQAGDISGTLFTLQGSSGPSQTVAAGSTVSILAAAGGNLTSVASATNKITLDITGSPTFTGTATIGTLSVTNGATIGTGLTVTSGGANITGGLTSSGAVTFSSLGAGVVQTNGSGVLSSANLNLATGPVTGQLGVGNGGTGAGSFTANGVLYGNGSGTIQATAAGSSGQCLVGNTGAAPTWNSCSGLVTLQNAYANGNTISTTGNDIGFTLNSSQNFTVTNAAGSNGFTTFALADGANPTPANQLVLVKNNDTNQAVATGVSVQAAAGGITTAFDASGANITNALAIGAHAITGTNFSVTSAGAVTAVGLNNNNGGITNAGAISGGTSLSSSGTITFSGLGSGIVQATSGVLSTGNVTLGSQTTGNYIAGLGTLTGLSASVSSGVGITPNLNVLYGGLSGQSVQGNTTLTCASGTGNLSGGGTVITLGIGGTCGSINTVSNPTFTGAVTLGATGSSTGSILFKGITGGSGTLTLIGPATPSTNTLTLPNETGTLCSTFSVCTGYAAATGSGSYIQNQTLTPQSANFIITGTGRADTSLLTPLLDTATAVPLAIGTNTATAINLNQNTAVASNKSFTANGAVLLKDATNSTTAFQVQNAGASTTLLNADTVNTRTTVTGQLAVVGGVNISGLSAPSAPSVTPSPSTGIVSYTYAISALNANGGTTLISPTTTTAISVSPLTGSQFNQIMWTGVPGASSYNIYRTASGGSPSSTGLIGNVSAVGTLVFNDTGFAATTAVPSVDTSGQLTANGTALFQNAVNSTSSFQIQNAAGTALVNADTTNLGVTLGSAGSTGFAAAANSNAGSSPSRLTRGDFNNDGLMDIAVSNTASSTVSIFINSGGTIPASATYTLTGLNSPIGISTGDFNGDGKTDIAVANGSFGATTTSVFINTGTPSAPFTLAAGTGGNYDLTGLTSPSAVAVGDFNHDGKTDLVAVNGGANTAAIFMNTGTALSTTATYTLTGLGASSGSGAAVLDINGDGNMDLVLINATGTVANVFTNTGNTGAPFTTAANTGGNYNLSGMSGASQIVAADFNGDGKPDVAISNGTANNVPVFINTGTALPTTATYTLTGLSNPNGLAAADFNGDGKPDLVAANGQTGTNTASLFFNTGNALPTTASATLTGLVAPGGAIAGDFDSNGRQDIAMTNSITGAGTISVFMNNTTSGSGTKLSVKADADGIGEVIQIGSNSSGDALQVVNGSGTLARIDSSGALSLGSSVTGGGGFAPKVDSTTGSTPKEVARADFNNDGLMDLAVANTGSNTVSIFINSGGSIPATATYTLTGLTSPPGLVAADFNNDGNTDLAVINSSGGLSGMSIFINSGNPSAPFTLAAGSSPNYNVVTISSTPSAIVAGDFDNNGLTDLAVSYLVSTSVSLYLNTTGSIPNAVTTNLTGLNGPTGMTVADFNGDGKTDLAVANTGSSSVSVFIGSGTAGTPYTLAAGSSPNYNITSLSTPGRLAAADFNGDGKTDLVVNSSLNSSTTASVFINTGSVLPSTASYSLAGLNGPTGMTVADFNGDGKTDLAVANGQTTTVSIFRNSGTALPTTPSSTLTGLSTPQGLAAADFNNDGRTDLGVVNSGANTLSVFSNTAAKSRLAISTNTSTSVGAVIQGVASQTADLLQIQNSSGITLAEFTANGTLQGGNGSGKDAAGSNLALAGGQGTGSATGGNIVLQIAKAGSSGTTANALTTVATISGSNGAATFQNATDSASGFQVQGTSGSTILDVDTLHGRVGIGTSSPGSYSLDVVGAINTSTGLWINGVNICSSAGCNPNTGTPSLPSSTWIQNGTTTQSGNFNIQSASPGSVGAIIEGASTQTADLLDLENGSAAVVASFSSNGSLTLVNNLTDNGNVTFQNSSGSTTAFRVLQNTSNTVLLNADTTNMVITIGGTSSSFASLTLNNAHFKSTQTTAPTIGTLSGCGTSPTSSVVAGSTDSAGKFTIHAGGTPAVVCTAIITFNKAYGAAPKSIIITGADTNGTGTEGGVSTATSTSFTFQTASKPSANADNSFYYWVVE